MSKEHNAHLEGSGAIARDGSDAAGAGGVAVGRDESRNEEGEN